MGKEKNVFTDITPKVKLPDAAKTEVLDRLAAAKLMLDFWDLFAPICMAVNITVLNLGETNTLKKKN
ncbi:hypothetical protein N8368_00320 [Bacteroidia bacterium]|nr:hypothetical protein [Bacteroidia bacterium]MDC1394934.1 hypothetical protein [Bacteroidia bacterium]